MPTRERSLKQTSIKSRACDQADCAKLGVKNCDQSNERSLYMLPNRRPPVAVQLIRHEDRLRCPPPNPLSNCSGTYGPIAYPASCPASCLVASTCTLGVVTPEVVAPTGVCRPTTGCWHGGLLSRNEVDALRPSPGSEFGRSCNWSAPIYTNLPDSPSRTCAASLPDGSIYLLSNPGPGRDPLVLSVAKDGLTFDHHLLVISATALGAPGFPCHFSKECDSGFHYPSALWRDDASELLVFYSVNKEDIGITAIPLVALQ